MNEMERIGHAGETQPASTGLPGGNLRAVRQEAEHLVAAVDNALDSILSVESATRVSQSIQGGGQ